MKRLHAALLAIAVLVPAAAGAACAPTPLLNPVTDLCWQCVFPLSVAGLTLLAGPAENNVPDLAKSPLCVCPMPPPLVARPGIPVSFWEPARYIETVKDPFCFPSLGGLSLPAGGGMLMGASQSQSSGQAFQVTTAQAHYFIYPVWSLLELLTDFICVEHSGFDVAFLTELDPLWQNDLLAFVIQPESLLFANPAAQAACMADSASSAGGFSLSPLFWCVASGGSVYPMTGTVAMGTQTAQAHNTVAARLQYMLGRVGLTCDTAIGLCGCVPTPIWVKHNYRFHSAKPVRDFWCHPFGRSDWIWGHLKNPAYAGDNFVWQIFRRRSCCAF